MSIFIPTAVFHVIPGLTPAQQSLQGNHKSEDRPLLPLNHARCIQVSNYSLELVLMRQERGRLSYQLYGR